MSPAILALLSVAFVSLLAFVGALVVPLSERLRRFLIFFFVAFSVGALFGDAFIHIVPEIAAQTGFTLVISGFVLLGILLFFVLEKFVHWHHCHANHDHCEEDLHDTHDEASHRALAVTILVGDGFHNFVDGLVIAASYVAAVPIGVATTLAVVFHEIPHELGNFAVLIHAGLRVGRALFFNFLSALTAMLGAIAGLLLASRIAGAEPFILAFTAGGFVYIAGSDLIPDLHRQQAVGRSLLQLCGILLGFALMYAVKVLGG